MSAFLSSSQFTQWMEDYLPCRQDSSTKLHQMAALSNAVILDMLSKAGSIYRFPIHRDDFGDNNCVF